MKLSIQIPITPDRVNTVTGLLVNLIGQTKLPLLKFKNHTGLTTFTNGVVEVMQYMDNKELSIGEKRQRMYESTKADYSVQIDSDDDIVHDYVEKVLNALQTMPDCVTYMERCHIQYGKRLFLKSVNHSIKYERWMDNHDKYAHVRTPFCKDVIKTELAVAAGVPFIRFNEDEQFAANLKPLLKTEIHIPEYMYIYKYTHSDHNIKYGIK